MRKLRTLAAALAASALLAGTFHFAPRALADAPAVQVAFKPAVQPKALGEPVKKGLAWLAIHQLESGAWGQGDAAPGHVQKSGRGEPQADGANVADTAMALMAFVRAGHGPERGEYRSQVRRGLEYVLAEVEASDADSLFVTRVRGTRVQSKIGTYVDTFTALMVLTELKGTADRAGNTRIDRALSKILAKIEKNQRKDGTWDNQGWAPALTQSMASKGLNRAAQAGEKVDDATLRRVEEQAQGSYDGRGFSSAGTAGIDLYGAAASTSAMRDSANTRVAREDEVKRKIAGAKTETERQQYERELRAGQQARGAADSAEQGLLQKLDDPAFIRGFGNNGGEEFLSYMLVSEALVVKGGAEWQKWDVAIAKLLTGVQNQDGSWTGHHCITGRTFCTAAALLVLMADRTPVPVAGKLRG
jgi:hypothetical protein